MQMYLREGLFSRIAAVVIISIGTHTYDMTVGAVQQQHYYYSRTASSQGVLRRSPLAFVAHQSSIRRLTSFTHRSAI